MHLPPSELSKHAVELEKRAIQLTIEEGRQLVKCYLVAYMETRAIWCICPKLCCAVRLNKCIILIHVRATLSSHFVIIIMTDGDILWLSQRYTKYFTLADI